MNEVLLLTLHVVMPIQVVYIAVGHLEIFGLSDSKILLSRNRKRLVKSLAALMPCPHDDNMNSLSE